MRYECLYWPGQDHAGNATHTFFEKYVIKTDAKQDGNMAERNSQKIYGNGKKGKIINRKEKNITLLKQNFPIHRKNK